MKILGVIGSPRKGSNTTLLLERLLAGASSQGAETVTIQPARMCIAPCIAFEGCYNAGRCVVQDEYQTAYDMILDCDALVIATPTYFGAMSAQVKAFVDRCQCFWAMRDIVKAPMPPGPAGAQRRGMLISTCGMPRMEMFEGARTTFRFLMRSLRAEYWGELLVPRCDNVGDVLQYPDALLRAEDMGRRLGRGLSAGN
jgi:putative NADPH-quinone reductase